MLLVIDKMVCYPEVVVVPLKPMLDRHQSTKGLDAAAASSEGIDFTNLKIDERWVSGTYIVCGMINRNVPTIDIHELIENRPVLFSSIRKNRRAFWPRGICGYYAIPVYIADGFSREVINWVQNRPKYRYAMWHEPLLYDYNENQAFTNARWGRYGLYFRTYLSERILDSLMDLIAIYGHEELPLVNGQKIF